MAPAIPIGSVVITARTPEEALKPGDVITYSLTEGTNDLVTHRIASRYAKPHYFITRGEANKQDDPIPVHYSQVVGKVILTLPMLGHVVDSFSSPLSAALLITMIFLLAAILQVVKRLMKENIA
jgi:signal peptidase